MPLKEDGVFYFRRRARYSGSGGRGFDRVPQIAGAHWYTIISQKQIRASHVALA